MALVTEDGTAKSDAESYCSVADADTHHAARGITNWATLSTGEKEQALRRATEFMLQLYRPLWAGYRKTDTQALDWPRYNVPKLDAAGGATFAPYYSDSVVPVEVRKACAELALRAAAGPLLDDQGREVVEQTVGPITTKYRPGASQAKRYAAVDSMLALLLTVPRGSGVMRLVRA